MAPLSQATEEHIDRLFTPADRDKVRTILLEECGDRIPGHRTVDGDFERIRFAALKLSDGQVDKLRAAVRMANIDFRDLLVAAGFANDPEAHKSWAPERR